MTTEFASHTIGLDVENHDGPIYLSVAISSEVCANVSEEYPARSKKVSSTIESETRCMSGS